MARERRLGAYVPGAAKPGGADAIGDVVQFENDTPPTA
jgi:hypothetical protein